MAAAAMSLDADAQRNRNLRARALLIPAAIIILTVFLVPLLTFLSFGLYGYARGAVSPDMSFDTIIRFATTPHYWMLVRNSVMLGAIVTITTLLLAYPAALVLASLRGTVWFPLFIIMIFSPLLTSVIVRSYGWMYLLSDGGFVNWLLMQLGITDAPVRMIYNWFGTVIAMVHLQVPFMMFPILTILMRLPPRVQDAARDLGANEWQTWLRVVRPLSLPGVLAGAQIVFSTSISAFASPTILGGGRVQVLPVSIYSSIQGLNWPMGAVQAVVLLSISLLLSAGFARLLRTRGAAPRRGA